MLSAESLKKIDREVATKLLTHFYPATENNDLSKNKFDRQSLKATVVAINLYDSDCTKGIGGRCPSNRCIPT